MQNPSKRAVADPHLSSRGHWDQHVCILLYLIILQLLEYLYGDLSFFSGKGPRSRRYGRAAALRLIVQPCDDNEDDNYFLSFS
jgi:hypothetical protein